VKKVERRLASEAKNALKGVDEFGVLE
jgi:hypothetical protein